MKNKVVVAVVVVLALLFVVRVIINNSSPEVITRPIAETMTVTSFSSGGDYHDVALVRIPFIERVEEGIISVFIGKVEVIHEIPFTARSNWEQGFYFEVTPAAVQTMEGRVVIDGISYNVITNYKNQDLGDLIDLATVTDPENSMKGLGSVAYADEGVVEITYDDVPDITQKPGECAPTAAANSLIDLVKKNGGKDLGDPSELIEELKGHMKWTMKNGVLPDDFVAGKNAWAAANNLPIETKKVGDFNGVTTVDEIRKALEAGAGVEMRIKFADNELNGKGGHMVTVTGIHTNGEQTYLDISDPYTEDSGTETIEINGNQVTNYGPWEQITVLSWGFVQTWTGQAEEDSTSLQLFSDPQFEGTFAHVKPGEYSEVYVAVTNLSPGEQVKCYLSGPDRTGGTPQIVDADANGLAHFTYRITQYGNYKVLCDDIDGNQMGEVDVVVN